MDWGDLVDEDSLPPQGPFPFHAEGSESAGTVEPGLPLGPGGAGGSAVTVGVAAEDRWTGADESETVPAVLVEGGGSNATPREVMEGSGSSAAPHETRETSPPALEQGAGSKRSRPDESGQGSGDPSPKCFRRPKASA